VLGLAWNGEDPAHHPRVVDGFTWTLRTETSSLTKVPYGATWDDAHFVSVDDLG
jgi:hypothetical protein